MVEQDFVEAEIGGERETIVGAGSNPVGVGALLALSVDARTGMLDERRGGSEAAVFANWKYRDASAVIIGDEHVLAGFVERDVAGAGALRGDLVE